MSFEQTSWTLIRQSTQADQTGRAALEELCRRYWEPLYLFARCSGRSAHDAEDDVQSFLSRSVEGELFGAAKEERGKFRTFLLTAFKRHLVDKYRSDSAQKRGGDKITLSISEEEGEFEILDEIPDPELAFDRRWAMRSVEEALTNLEARYTPAEFSVYQPFLLSSEGDYTSAAARLEISLSGFKVGVHRIRKRFREELEKVISSTISNENDFESEMSYLLEILSEYSING